MFLLTNISCSGKGPLWSDSDFALQTQRYYTGLSNSVEFSSPVTILHRGGAFQEYAKNINCEIFGTKAQAKDIADMMDCAFSTSGVDAIEIDLRTIPGSAEFSRVYIVHDGIDPDIVRKDIPSIRGYLSRNSIDQVIEHFIKLRYAEKRKQLFLELKAPRKSLFSNNGPLDAAEKQYVRQSVDAVNSTIERLTDEPLRKQVKDRIAFISFNIFALEEVYNISGKSYGLHFLAATNRPLLGRIGTFRDYELNYLNGDLVGKLIAAEWLDGIWFDPRAIDDAALIFNSINNRRTHPAGIFLFAYELPYHGLVRRMEESVYSENGIKQKLRNVRGLCFEVQKYRDTEKQASCN